MVETRSMSIVADAAEPPSVDLCLLAGYVHFVVGLVNYTDAAVFKGLSTRRTGLQEVSMLFRHQIPLVTFSHPAVHHAVQWRLPPSWPSLRGFTSAISRALLFPICPTMCHTRRVRPRLRKSSRRKSRCPPDRHSEGAS